jgi:hypothetical protein
MRVRGDTEMLAKKVKDSLAVHVREWAGQLEGIRAVRISRKVAKTQSVQGRLNRRKLR